MSDRLEAMRDEVRAFVDRRNWHQFHNPKNLTMALASEAGELLDLFRWVDGDEADEIADDGETRGRVKDEIGDVGLCLLMLCDRLDVDLIEAMEEKLERNRETYPIEEVQAPPEDA